MHNSRPKPKNYMEMLPKFIPTENDIHFINTKIPDEIIEELLNRWKKCKLNGYKTVIVNVNDIDTLWKQDTGHYIEPYSNTEKYIHSKEDILHLHETRLNVPPMIGLKDNHITFKNGRHRFANLRDNGVISIPVLIPNNEIKKFNKLGLITESVNGGKSTKRKYKTRKCKTRKI